MGVGSGRDSGGAQAVDVRHRNRGHNSGGYHSGKLASWRVGEPFWVSPCFWDTFAVKRSSLWPVLSKKIPAGGVSDWANRPAGGVPDWAENPKYNHRNCEHIGGRPAENAAAMADGRGGRTKIVRPGGVQSSKNAVANGGGGASGSLDRFLVRE